MVKQESNDAKTMYYLVPGLPHVLLAPERSSHWNALHKAYEQVRDEIAASGAEVIIYFSTQWFSVLGTMIQGRKQIKGHHVDGNWHHLGTMHYEFSTDTKIAKACFDEIANLGITTKLIDYEGFPLDTGTIVAQTLLNPGGRLPTCIVSCNIYASETEVVALGEACKRALNRSGKKAAVVLVSSLSHRFHTLPIDPREDCLTSASDDTWNRKILSLWEKGRLGDIVELCPSFAREASADLGFKGACWLAGMCSDESELSGTVLSYQAVWGTGAAVCRLTAPERNTLETISLQETVKKRSILPKLLVVDATKAPAPVGAYPHARRVGNLLFLSGIGPRMPEGKGIAGVEWDDNGAVVTYDISLQTRQVFANVEAILKELGCSLDAIVDIQVFLTNMKRDFLEFNRVYSEYFDFSTGPCRTTVEVGALPTPIAVEFKVVAALSSPQ